MGGRKIQLTAPGQKHWEPSVANADTIHFDSVNKGVSVCLVPTLTDNLECPLGLLQILSSPQDLAQLPPSLRSLPWPRRAHSSEASLLWSLGLWHSQETHLPFLLLCEFPAHLCDHFSNWKLLPGGGATWHTFLYSITRSSVSGAKKRMDYFRLYKMIFSAFPHTLPKLIGLVILSSLYSCLPGIPHVFLALNDEFNIIYIHLELQSWKIPCHTRGDRRSGR